MRIVLDTNVLARAITGPQGPASAVLRAIVPPHILVLSPFILSELVRVLSYPRLRAMHSLDDDEIAQFINDLQAGALVVPSTAESFSPMVPDDPQDDAVLATVLVGKADVLCTRDRHFWHPAVREFCKQRKIRILTDTEVLDLL